MGLYDCNGDVWGASSFGKTHKTLQTDKLEIQSHKVFRNILHNALRSLHPVHIVHVFLAD